MGKRKLPYKLGTLFAVPLTSGGYGTGIIARANFKGGALGYFFGPRRSAPPKLEEVAQLRPNQAALVTQFGDLGLIRGEWPIIGTAADWRPEDWPMPAFFYRDNYKSNNPNDKAWLRYHDDNLKFVHEERCDLSLMATTPRDGSAGQGYLETQLDRLLSP